MEAKTTHTPGPWEFHADNIGTHYGTQPYWGIVVRGCGESIVKVPCGFLYRAAGEDECEANARLVAAAPCQHKALIAVDSLLHEIAEYLRDHHDVSDGDYGEPRPNRAMQLSNELDEVAAKVSAALSRVEQTGKRDE